MGLKDWLSGGGGRDFDQFRNELSTSYEADCEKLALGPEPYVHTDEEKAAVARLFEPIRTKLDAFAAGGVLPDPAPDARLRFIALEEAERDEDSEFPEDPQSFAFGNTLGVQLGLAIRDAEGNRTPEPPQEFLEALALEDEGTLAVKLRELADWHARDFTGPPNEDGDPGHAGTDPQVLALFSENEQVFKALSRWAEEYVRLASMPTPGFAIVMDRTKAVRFGYLLGCYLDLGPEPDEVEEQAVEVENGTDVQVADESGEQTALKSLRELHKLGLLTDEEFAEKKRLIEGPEWIHPEGLESLTNLRDKGVLTEEEFGEKKRRLMGRD